jgi:signal transduction histidine kinase
LANRKYLSRDENKSKPADSDAPKKEIFLEKTQAKGSTNGNLEGIGGDIKNVNEYINSLNKHILDQRTRIENMKKLQSNFEKELQILTSGEIPIPVQSDKTEFDGLGKEFNGEETESAEVIGSITSIVEKEVQNRILVLESQLVEEKKNADEFRKMLEQNLKKFNRIEKNLKTDKAKLESEIKEKTDKLVQAERLSAIGDLGSRLAHDLKNPLSVIKGTVQLIKRTDKNLDELTRKRVELIESAIFRMTHQIDGVLEFVRSTPLKKKPASLNEIIVSALHSMMIPANIAINFPKEDIVFLCDSHKMQIVFANLILNSIQAIGNGKGVINIRAKKQEDTITIRIEDSGPGIASEIADKIFDPLFTTKQEGTGLGLACCKSIVEQHNGKISMSGDPTVFWVVLPLF